MRRLGKILLAVLAFVAVQRLCHRATDGFTPPKIQSQLEFHPEWEVVEQDTSCASELLSKNFHYLGRGAQAYVFASEDGKTVIKFFRHHRMRTLLCKVAFLLPGVLKARLQQTIDKRKAKLHKDFESYKLAYTALKEETGLIFIHLNKTQDLKQKLTLFDKIGVRHEIDLDRMEFVVQKRADLIYPTLSKWIQEQNYAQAKASLSELVALLKTRCQKGFFDKDPDLRTNFGLIDGHPIQIDIGRFKEDLTRKDPTIYRDEIIRITDRLAHWLDKRAPELALHLQSEVNSLP